MGSTLPFAQPAPGEGDPEAGFEGDSALPGRLDRYPAELGSHIADLMRQAGRLVSDPAEAQDLVQDTLERAVRAIDRFKPGTNMRAWLYTILVRRACDHHRLQRARRRCEAIEPDTLPAPAPDEPSPWVNATEADVRLAVSRLHPIFREVFVMHEVDHLPYQDIAARLDIPIGTVGTRLRRARHKLKNAIRRVLEARQAWL